MTGLMERLKPIRKLLWHLGRITDIRPAIAEGGIPAHRAAYVLRRPPFIQSIQPCKVLILGQAEFPVLAREVGYIPFAPQIILHIVGGSAELHCLPHIGTVDIVAGRLAVFLIQPYRTGGCFAGLFNDGQSILPAQSVGDFHHSLSLGFGVVIFSAVPKRNGIKAEVTVDMFLVEVGGDDDFKAVAPHLLCQLYANLVGKLRRDLLRLEALIPMPSDIAVSLTVTLLGQNHLPQRRFFQAVEGGDILALLRGLRAPHIGKHIVQVLQFRRFRLRLFGILYIVDEVFQTAFDVPKRSRCH